MEVFYSSSCDYREKIHLQNNNKNTFDRARSDTFKVRASCVGPMKKVRIEHDNAGFNAGWLCDHVEIINLGSGVRTMFPCHKWLDKKKGDGELFKELFPAKE